MTRNLQLIVICALVYQSLAAPLFDNSENLNFQSLAPISSTELTPSNVDISRKLDNKALASSSNLAIQKDKTSEKSEISSLFPNSMLAPPVLFEDEVSLKGRDSLNSPMEQIEQAKLTKKGKFRRDNIFGQKLLDQSSDGSTVGNSNGPANLDLALDIADKKGNRADIEGFNQNGMPLSSESNSMPFSTGPNSIPFSTEPNTINFSSRPNSVNFPTDAQNIRQTMQQQDQEVQLFANEQSSTPLEPGQNITPPSFQRSSIGSKSSRSASTVQDTDIWQKLVQVQEAILGLVPKPDDAE